jgi:outer membrane protein
MPQVAGAETLADALVRAYQTSPLLSSSRAALRSLDETVPQARATRRPQVSAGAAATSGSSLDDVGDLDTAGNRLEAFLQASLLLFDNGQSKAAIESARNSVAAGRADLKNVEQLVLFDAVQAYVDVRRDEEFVRLAQTDVSRLEETLNATQNRFEVGEVTRTDVSQSEARLAASRSTLADSRGQLEISREAFRAAVGSYPQNLEALPQLPEVPGDLAAATAIALQRNPAVISAQYAERASVYDFDRARAAKGPSVAGSLSGGGQHTNINTFTGDYENDTFIELGISGSMPLYTGGANDSLIRQAQALVDQRRFEVQDTARSVTQQVAAAWAQLEVARVTIIARREQAEASRIAAEGVAEEARLGARSTLEVLDADQERLQAEAEIVVSMRDEYVAVYALLQAMGLLTVEHLGLGIQSYDPDINYARVQDAPSGGYDTSVVDKIRARWEN